MGTLAGPVLLRCMATNSRKASVSIGPAGCYIRNATEPPPPESLLTLKGRNIPFVNSVNYLGVIFEKRITWRLHIERIEVKAFRTFNRLYSLFTSERLHANIKLTLLKTLISSVM
jgi:hypothetical protein